jgi:hypothetical protein
MVTSAESSVTMESSSAALFFGGAVIVPISKETSPSGSALWRSIQRCSQPSVRFRLCNCQERIDLGHRFDVASNRNRFAQGHQDRTRIAQCFNKVLPIGHRVCVFCLGKLSEHERIPN